MNAETRNGTGKPIPILQQSTSETFNVTVTVTVAFTVAAAVVVVAWTCGIERIDSKGLIVYTKQIKLTIMQNESGTSATSSPSAAKESSSYDLPLLNFDLDNDPLRESPSSISRPKPSNQQLYSELDQAEEYEDNGSRTGEGTPGGRLQRFQSEHFVVFHTMIIGGCLIMLQILGFLQDAVDNKPSSTRAVSLCNHIVTTLVAGAFLSAKHGRGIVAAFSLRMNYPSLRVGLHNSTIGNTTTSLPPLMAYFPIAVIYSIASWSRDMSLKYLHNSIFQVFQNSKVIAVMGAGTLVNGTFYKRSQYIIGMLLMLGCSLVYYDVSDTATDDQDEQQQSNSDYTPVTNPHVLFYGVCLIFALIATFGYALHLQWQERIFLLYGRNNFDLIWHVSLGIHLFGIGAAMVGILLSEGDTSAATSPFYLVVSANCYCWKNFLCLVFLFNYGPFYLATLMTTFPFLSQSLSRPLHHGFSLYYYLGAVVVVGVLAFLIRESYLYHKHRLEMERLEEQRQRDIERREEQARQDEAMMLEVNQMLLDVDSQHLQEFLSTDDNKNTATYEDWIENLHPENVVAKAGFGHNKTIDHRFYVHDSDHRGIWNSSLQEGDGRLYVHPKTRTEWENERTCNTRPISTSEGLL